MGYVMSVFPVAGQEQLAAIPILCDLRVFWLPARARVLLTTQPCGAPASSLALHPAVAGLHVRQGAWTSRSRCAHVLGKG